MKIAPLFSSMAFLCALSTGLSVVATASAATKTSAAPEPAQREIAYADLETQVGKRITVHTRLGTVRSGILTKYTKSEIDMKLDEGTDLTVPANTIRSLSIPVPPPETPTKGDGSAKKN
ncbi:MAG: hypothetical protein P4L92_22240 [Rudaea sp.]|nr:hypothetical protein [Rudaea sp.]